MPVPCRYRTAVVPLWRLSRGALVMTLQPMLLKTFCPSTTGRDERDERVFAVREARAAEWGGVAALTDITGLARSRIIRGLKDLDGPALEPGRVRRAGGGRPTVMATDSTLLGDLTRLVEPATMGDPMRPLTWVSK